MADNAFKTGQKLWSPFGNKKEEKTEESAYGRGKGKGKFKVRKSPKGRHTKGKKGPALGGRPGVPASQGQYNPGQPLGGKKKKP